MLHRKREEHAASIQFRRLLELMDKEIFVQLIEKEERDTCEAIDDRRDHHVCNA